MLFYFSPEKPQPAEAPAAVVAPLPPVAPCQGHIPVQGSIPPSPPSPLCLRLGPLSCCLRSMLCPHPSSLEEPPERAELGLAWPGARVGRSCGAAADRGLQPRARRCPGKGGHLLSSQRSRLVSATRFSIVELLGGQAGVTHTAPGRGGGSERSGSALGNGGTIPGPRHRNRNRTPDSGQRWGWGGAAGGSRGSGDAATRREGTRQAHGDKEEREPSWQLLPLSGDTEVAGNDPQQSLRPVQANLRLRVPQKWHLNGT